MSIDKFLAASQEVEPLGQALSFLTVGVTSMNERLVPNVRILFEAYVYLHGTERDRKLYDDLILESKTLDEQRRSLLLCLRGLSRPHKKPWSLQNPHLLHFSRDDYFGLSNRGFVTRAHCNMGLSQIFSALEDDCSRT